MKRNHRTQKAKPLSPIWLYVKIICLLILGASFAWLYQFQSQWQVAAPVAVLAFLCLLFAPNQLRSWPKVFLSFIRYSLVFTGLTYALFVGLDIHQGVALRQALTAPYRLAILIFEPMMPFSALLVGVIAFLLFGFALRKRH